MPLIAVAGDILHRGKLSLRLKQFPLPEAFASRRGDVSFYERSTEHPTISLECAKITKYDCLLFMVIFMWIPP